MLSSQIVSVSHTSLSSLLQTSMSSSTAMFRSNGTLPRRPRPRHQIRTIRIGLWSSYLEPNYQKEFRRRNRALKYKYIETINRKLSWDRQHPGSVKQQGFKGFMCSAWRGHDARPGGRWINMDTLTTENSDQQRNNNGGIGDVEMSALNKLWGKDRFYELLRARSREFRDELNGLNSTIFKSHPFMAEQNRDLSATTAFYQASDTKTPQAGRKTQLNEDTAPEYEIDPITNRKVLKKDQHDGTGNSSNIPVKTFKGYRSQFTVFQPPKSEIDKKELDPIQEKQPTESALARDYLQDYEGAETYKPFFAYEPDGEKPSQTQEESRASDRATFKWSSWFISPAKSTAESTVRSCPVQEGLRDYDNRTSYEPSPWNQSENKVPSHVYSSDPVHHGLKDFDSITCYGPLKSSMDGKAAVASEDRTKEGLHSFDTKTSYGPVMHNEPDGKLPDQPDATSEGLQDFDSKAGYGQREDTRDVSLKSHKTKTDKLFGYQHNTDTREDLDLLRPSDIRAASGISKKSIKESEAEKIAKRQELEEDFQRPQKFSHTSEILATPKKSEAKPVEESLPKLTGNFVRDFPEEFSTSWSTSGDGSGRLSIKSKANSFAHETDSNDSNLLYQQQVESDVQKAEKAYIEGRASTEDFSRNPNTPRLQTSLDRGIRHNQETGSIEKIGTEKTLHSKRPQGLESSYADECKLQSEVDPYSKEPRGLETNYAEERALNNGDDNHGAQPSSESKISLTKEEHEVIDRLCGRGFLRDQAVQAYFSCNRNEELTAWFLTKQSGNDLSTDKVALGPDHKDKGLVDQLRHIYESTYGKIDLIHRQVPEAATDSLAPDNAQASKLTLEAQEPTMYKILAYDPTMQSINIAETTSIVNDTASALTPAEVLLRLSNPTKFFPHFQPLQEDGYEIASGSGDVLVFRKVRNAGLPSTKSETLSSYQERARQTTNPIDGMQSRPIAATGNFASPTGFVNYDQPDSSEPVFKSNIDVRREEPVFSGKSAWSKEGTAKRQRPGLGKRVLLGGAMVGGCSYAIGVVSEYFKSGGTDGLGPQTF